LSSKIGYLELPYSLEWNAVNLNMRDSLQAKKENHFL